jgi:hypothetical protein
MRGWVAFGREGGINEVRQAKREGEGKRGREEEWRLMSGWGEACSSSFRY